MRTFYRRLMSSSLAFMALLAAVLNASAQDVVPLGMVNSEWRFFQAGSQPTNQNNVAWRATNYNDTSWSTGIGVFGVEDALMPPGAFIQTGLDLVAPGMGTNQTITYYFRTTFNYTQSTLGVELVFTNIIDDGAVIYLNGTQLYRVRVPGTGFPAYTNLAESAPEVTLEYTNILNSPLLRQGLNTIAVEVHQSSTTSTDITFGLGLLIRRPVAIQITQEPEDVDVDIGQQVSLSVDVTGTNPRFQWYKNGAVIPGATNATYTTNNAPVAVSGTYHVVVSNHVSRVESRRANVRVGPDDSPLVALRAYIRPGDTNLIHLDFDDAIMRVNPTNAAYSAVTTSNYVIVQVGATNVTNALSVTVAAVNQRLLRLTVSPNLDPTKEYCVLMSRVMDDAYNPLPLNTRFCVGWRYLTNIVAFQSDWRANASEFDGSLDNGAWTALNYNDDPFAEPYHWFDSQAAFYHDTTDTNNFHCTVPHTDITIGPNTYYFRKKFVLPPEFIGADVTALISHIIDDGAVFYLNGVELGRWQMPFAPAPINYGTLASTAVGVLTCGESRFANIGHLLARTNILAVEVHQAANPDPQVDAAFDLELDLEYAFPIFQPTLHLRKLTQNSIRLNWTNAPGKRFTLETTTNIVAAWSPLTPATTNTVVTNTITGPARYYRLRQSATP